MTSKSISRAAPAAVAVQPLRRRWALQDAKARFSELVRLASAEGPQHVTLHDRDAVVVVDAAEFRRLKGAPTGQLLIDAMQASPHQDAKLTPARSSMAVRAVKL
jgi:prevent-host-death family protein